VTVRETGWDGKQVKKRDETGKAKETGCGGKRDLIMEFSTGNVMGTRKGGINKLIAHVL